MGKYLDIARKLKKQMADSLGSHIRSDEPVTQDHHQGGVDFVSLLTKTERKYYLDLLEIMQSEKYKLDKDTAERAAGAIIARNRHPLQINQDFKNYQQNKYIKLYSTVLGKAVYLVKNEQTAKRVPDRTLPIFLETDVEALRDLDREEAKLIMEGKILLGGSITK